MVAGGHPTTDPRLVESIMGPDAQEPAGLPCGILRGELVAVPIAPHVDQQEVPGAQAHVLDDALHLGVELHERAEVVRDHEDRAYAGYGAPASASTTAPAASFNAA
jgi:hypothetical protein